MSKEITGTLKHWDFHHANDEEYVIVGYLYGDVNARWEDGTQITTSGIRYEDFPTDELEDGSIINTRNSTYKLGKRELAV